MPIQTENLQTEAELLAVPRVVSSAPATPQEEALELIAASAEGSMGPHLHFSVSKDGQVIDPADYVN